MTYNASSQQTMPACSDRNQLGSKSNLNSRVEQTQRIAIFPLQVFLLPEGVTRLRIFEQRYIRMVKEACSGQGFVLSLFDAQSEFNTSTWGTHVRIVNFEQSPDGLLYIDIQATQLVNISQLKIEQDGLRVATITPREHWPPLSNNTYTDFLADKLKNVFSHNPALSELYPQPHFQSANWVCSRWLEILPVALSSKLPFINMDTQKHAIEFIYTIIHDNE